MWFVVFCATAQLTLAGFKGYAIGARSSCGPDKDTQSSDISERQILLGVDGLASGAGYEGHILLARLEDTTWITLDTDFREDVEG